MSNIQKTKKMLNEIKMTLLRFVIFEAMLNSAIVFLACYLIVILLKVNGVYALIPAVIYFIYFFFKRVKSVEVKKVEQEYSFLNERLRTLKDNVEVENVIVNELRDEVETKLKKVSTSSFLNIKKAVSRILITVFLCFLIIFVTVTHLMFFDFNTLMSDITKKIAETDFFSDKSNPLEEEAFGNDDIFGKESELVALGEDEKELNIVGVENQISTGKEEEEKPSSEFPSPASDASYEEKISPEIRDLIKAYFTKITH